MIDRVKQEFIEIGLNPDDFNISEKDGVIQVSPKWYLEMKQIAKKEDEPIKQHGEYNEDYLLDIDFRLMMIELGL